MEQSRKTDLSADGQTDIIPEILCRFGQYGADGLFNHFHGVGFDARVVGSQSELPDVWPCRPRTQRSCYAQELGLVRDRKLHKSHKWRADLAQTAGGIVTRFRGKPKWMRWHSHLRLRRRTEELERETKSEG